MTTAPPLTLDDWKRMYRSLWRIRAFEAQVQRLAAAGEVPGFPHLSTGQEAVAVGVCAHLTLADSLFTSHRGHGHILAKGSDPEAMFAEILGRQTGLCHGRGGSMHLVDKGCNVLGATGVVGGNLPLAAGAAWAAQALQTGGISVVFFGDGASSAGIFHETLNLAVLWNLPLLLVCENNGYAEFTSREEHSKVQHVSAFAAPFAVQARTIDGNDLPAVHSAAGEAVAMLREGKGPYLLECLTHRMSGHFVGDAQHYRSREELEQQKQKCPIERLGAHLTRSGLTVADLEALGESARQEIQQAAGRARAAARPDPGGVCADVYSAPALDGIQG